MVALYFFNKNAAKSSWPPMSAARNGLFAVWNRFEFGHFLLAYSSNVSVVATEPQLAALNE
jgi:hypothetical protein